MSLVDSKEFVYDEHRLAEHGQVEWDPVTGRYSDELAGDSEPGQIAAETQRAEYIDWMNGLLALHPDLVTSEDLFTSEVFSGYSQEAFAEEVALALASGRAHNQNAIRLYNGTPDSDDVSDFLSGMHIVTI